MIAVIFEVVPTVEGKSEYLHVAQEMRKYLEGRQGLISIERFQSLTDDGKVLSLSFWEDIDSITQWRNQMAHSIAEESGIIPLMFKSYRIRTAEVFQDHSEVLIQEEQDAQGE
ncbi:antibiotic biosynthesis monooxygenase [Shewanella sp. SR44-3]|uniref:antibiotic biosynthesis monooxygenase family protein n=1 Tax=unclassified Shewanella TaxID=196818 RepID=UPI0015FD9BB1|nr:antibiotic biosynthesis monooxygenase [Shewanella sp. SR44-3]MBB1270614.1 antibiotic biosynthesis monooxygenase [Shewanella sp. SR44-3]